MSTELTNIQEPDYNEILLQAVAVIESSRTQIARKLNESVSNAYWNIGKLLYDRKIEGKHGDSVVKRCPMI